MRWSTLFAPTLRDDPAQAEAVSHKLMLRAGLVRQLGAGLYSALPLGRRVLLRIAGIIRDEMDSIGAQEFHHPALHPAELWRQSGRWDAIGEEMFRLQDRKRADMCLGMTHEEVFTWIARSELRSYKQLPQIWYQIQTKFRDEARPKSGVLRSREFTMKDSYSFDVDDDGLDRAFDLHAGAYRRVFGRCGVRTVEVQASSGAMGGSESVEFMALSDAGEDWVVQCAACGYAANLEKATSVIASVEDPPGNKPIEKFPTPGIRTIEELVDFEGGATADRQLKTLVFVVDDETMLFVLRGDHTINEIKIVEATGAARVRPAHPEECRAALGALPGSLGAVGVEHLRVHVDDALRGRRGMTTGANVDDFHIRNVEVDRDLQHATSVSLRNVEEGDRCPSCEQSLKIDKAIELGHIFKLGRRYSESMGASILDADGKRRPFVMGSYGIGLERLAAAIIEHHHDERGIAWPSSVAPFAVVVTALAPSESEVGTAAEAIYEELRQRGVDTILDDRAERPGVKFADADLIGIPVRVVVGQRGLKQGKVELVERSTGERTDVDVTAAVAAVTKLLSPTKPS